MSLTLVLGGARSGKSRYAESLLRVHPTVTYVAPGEVPDGFDPEWAERISLHQARRPADWSTRETTELAGVISSADCPVLIDCLSTWLARVIDDIDAWQDRGRAASNMEKETARLLNALGAATADVVLVTNEVGLSVVPSTPAGRLFRDELGRLNAALSAASDQVYLVVAGRVLDLSGCPWWPFDAGRIQDGIRDADRHPGAGSHPHRSTGRRILPEAPKLLRMAGRQITHALVVPITEALLIPVGVDLRSNAELVRDRGTRLDGPFHARGDDARPVVPDERTDAHTDSQGLTPAL